MFLDVKQYKATRQNISTKIRTECDGNASSSDLRDKVDNIVLLQRSANIDSTTFNPQITSVLYIKRGLAGSGLKD